MGLEGEAYPLGVAVYTLYMLRQGTVSCHLVYPKLLV